MIKICVISPASHLKEFSSLGDCEMALTHLVVPEAGFEHSGYVKENYVKYFQQRAAEGKWTILDNSAYEIGRLEATQASGRGLGPELVLQAAEIIKPSIVIAQDVLCDSQATYESTVAFIECVKKKGLLGQFQIMAVAQGKTEEEWLQSFDDLSSLDEVDQIGLSKISVPLSFGGSQAEDGCVAKARLRCTAALASGPYSSDDFNSPRKPIHLLGGDNHLPWELSQQAKHWFVFSNDSSATVWYGAHGKTYDHRTGKIDNIITKKPDLENLKETTAKLLDDHQLEIISNIATLHRYSKGTLHRYSKG